jgi:sugar phosphate isomerase/epimerase
MTDHRISFQLYSARKSPPVAAQLEKLAAIGYDAVEPYHGAYGDDPAGFRKLIDVAGLACPSAHVGLDSLYADRDAVIETAKTLGLEIAIIPAVAERSQELDGWKALGAKLDSHANALATAGLKLAWHNHAYEYATLEDGSRPIDHLLSGTNVLWEPDLGWITRAGADLRAELTKFSGKVAAFHIKDPAPEGVTVDDGWTDVGAGTTDWQAVWSLITGTDTNLLVIEHDEPSDWLSFATHSYDFVTKLIGRGG